MTMICAPRTHGILQGQQALSRLKKSKLTLNEYESLVAVDLVEPDNLKVGWSDIGGLDDTVAVLKVCTQ